MSPEAIAAVDLDAEFLWQGLANLAAERLLVMGFKDNALQLQRARSELQALEDKGDRGERAMSLSLQIRSRQEGARIMVHECRKIVFGDFVDTERFRIVAGEDSPWDCLPVPYRNPGVPASAALEIMKLQMERSPEDAAAARLRLDQLFAELDALEGVMLMRTRTHERLPRVLAALEAL